MNVNGLYFNRERGVFRLTTYCESPTAKFEHVATGETVGGAVGCLNLAGIKPINELSLEESLIVIHRLADECERLRREYDGAMAKAVEWANKCVEAKTQLVELKETMYRQGDKTHE